MSEKIIISVTFIVIIFSAWFFYHRRKDTVERPLTLGKELADAVEKEAQRVEENPPQSPMPPETYTRKRGEWDLLNPKQVELDDSLRELCSSFQTLSDSERTEFRRGISLEEFYTLLAFARRSCVFALRNEDQQLLKNGITAITMIESDRTDFRDILMALALLHHSGERLNLSSDSEFRKAATLAEPETSKLLRGFVEKGAESKILEKSWGYTEVGSGSETGFARLGFRKYEPEADLLEIGKQIARVIESDRYFVESLQIATKLPTIWLDTPSDQTHVPLIENASGGATISCHLEDGSHPDSSSQQFTVFIEELDSAESASALEQRSNKIKSNKHSMLGIASGKIFVLVIARSFVSGVDAFETPTSIERFRDPIVQSLPSNS